ncbi:MAG: hybrid sensor histidine kinase/response regulator [Trichlorobacter sp.]|jgi:signal transduction histidine kinase
MTIRKQILLVENGAQAPQLAAQLLTAAGSFELHQATDCAEACGLIPGKRFDLILLGSPAHAECLPPLGKLRELGSDPAVIALLDANEEGRYLTCLKEGAVDCMMAPFTGDELIKRMERGMALKLLDREKQDFVSMLSHDLKNPITAVIGSVDLVREGRLGPVNTEQAEYLMSAIDSCIEVVAMIDNLLDIHRFEAGKMHLRPVPVNLADLVRQVTTSYRGAALAANLRLTTLIDDGLPQVVLDRDKFSRVLANLLNNSARFTAEGGEITVTCSQGISADSELAIILSVRDTGEGIPAADLPQIFDRFVQARNHGSRGGGGSGLGLAFCKMTVEAHGGSISAASRQGHGSEFIITLPAPEK